MTSVSQLCNEWDAELTSTPAALRRSLRMAQEMDGAMEVGTYRHRDGPIPLRPVLMSATQAARLAALSRRLLRLLKRTCDARASCPSELAELLDYHHPVVSLLSDDPATNAAVLDMARPDVVISGGVPRFVECNINSAIGGPEQVARLNQFYRSVPGTGGRWLGDGRLSVPDPHKSRRNAIMSASRARGVPEPRVCILGWSTHGFGSAAYFADVIDDFDRQHIPCVFAVPSDLDFSAGALTHRGQRIDLVLRMFVTADAHEANLDLAQLRQAMRAGATAVLSPELGSLYASKKVLAWLSESTDAMAAADRHFVRTHLPWTRVVADGSVTWEGNRASLLDLLIRERERFLLKPVDQHGGDGIVVGRDVDEDVWEKAVSSSSLGGRYVAQEFWAPDPLTVPVLLPAEGAVRFVQAACVFGPMIFGGRLGGVQVRHTDRPTTSMVNAFGGRGGVMNSAWIIAN